MENKNLFNGKAEDYKYARPSYPAALIGHLYCEVGFSESSVIADIGSGTGKLAKQLLEKGSKVYCIEPNDEMRASAQEELKNCNGFVSINAAAENTTLADSCIDFITAAQAFHWFDTKKFKTECKRIARPQAKAVLVWNMRSGENPLHKECKRIFEAYCPRFKGFTGGVKDNDDRIKYFFDNRFDFISFDHSVCCTQELFLRRCLSGSYALTSADVQFTAFKKALLSLFEEFAVDDAVQMEYKTVAYIGYI